MINPFDATQNSRADTPGPRLEPGCPTCDEYREHHERTGSWPMGPRHDGSETCESFSLASGGHRAHCTCDLCW